MSLFQVPPAIQKQRHKICLGCKFLKPGKKPGEDTCGTPWMAAITDGKKEIDISETKGDIVTHYKAKIRLCGCRVDVKTKYSLASCPARKWGRWTKATDGKPEDEREKLSTELSEKIKEVLLPLQGRSTFTHVEVRAMFRLEKEITGMNRYGEFTMCPPCVTDVVTSLRKELKQILDDE